MLRPLHFAGVATTIAAPGAGTAMVTSVPLARSFWLTASRKDQDATFACSGRRQLDRDFNQLVLLGARVIFTLGPIAARCNAASAMRPWFKFLQYVAVLVSSLKGSEFRSVALYGPIALLIAMSSRFCSKLLLEAGPFFCRGDREKFTETRET